MNLLCRLLGHKETWGLERNNGDARWWATILCLRCRGSWMYDLQFWGGRTAAQRVMARAKRGYDAERAGMGWLAHLFRKY